jgi:hypothetical protein
MSSITIQFIGLLLFTGRMVSVMPTERAQPVNSDLHSVAYRPMATIKITPLQTQRYEVTVLAPTVTHKGVQTHQTMILFKGTPIAVSRGWQVQGPLNSGWSYIQLSNAARVEFVVDTANSAVTPLTRVSLPKLGGTLKPAYMGPSYAETSAVFTIRDGTLATCNGGDSTRIDTTLRLNVRNSLTIKSGANNIVLPATAQVAIANVPLDYADHPTTFSEAGTTAHSIAYCDMIGVTACTLSHPQVATACPYFVRGPGISGKTAGTDFACSNSQWP